MVAETPQVTVRDNTESRCYDALVDDEVVGSLVYDHPGTGTGSRIVFRHTIVEPEFRGRGIGTALAKAALDDVRAKGMTLSNYCGFVSELIADRPEYTDLIDAEHPGILRRK
jgi:uncharacterized protein